MCASRSAYACLTQTAGVKKSPSSFLVVLDWRRAHFSEAIVTLSSFVIWARNARMASRASQLSYASYAAIVRQRSWMLTSCFADEVHAASQ